MPGETEFIHKGGLISEAEYKKKRTQLFFSAKKKKKKNVK